MPNLTPIDPDRPGAASDILAAILKSAGRVPNIYATMAHSPAALEGFLAFSGALESGVLNAALREQIALAVAGENRCDYCASAHTFLATRAGVDADETARNLAGDASDPKTAAILRFVRTVVHSRAARPESVTALGELRDAGIGDAEIVETLAHIGLNLFTNYFNHVVDTEIDFPRITVDPATAVA